MKISRNIGISFVSLACAGAIGGVTAVSLVGHQPSPDQTVVRNVSGVAGADPSPSGQASAPAAVTPSANSAATAPTVDGTTAPTPTSNPTRSPTVTEPNPTPAPAPAPAPTPTTAPAPAPAPTVDRMMPPPMDPRLTATAPPGPQEGHLPPAP